MGNRVNIGIYIGPQDTDIAAWFNLLQEKGQSRAKWARGLLCAYALHQKLPIGAINPAAPLVKETAAPASDTTLLFGTGSSQAETKRRDRYGYGWQIRGPHREFIVGSVINISISKAEVLPILDETWRNGHARATFLKSLIRDNLEYGDKAIPPKLEDLQKVYAAYMVRENSRKVQQDRTPQRKGGGQIRDGQNPNREEKKEPRPARQEPERQGGHPKRGGDGERAARAFDFSDMGAGAAESHAQSLEKNPLLSQI